MRELEMRWEDLTFWEQTFWGIAMVFTLLSIIQLVAGLFGLEIEQESEAQAATKDKVWFTSRNAIFFFAFFGWSGALMNDDFSGSLLQLVVVVLVGVLGTLIVSYVDRVLINWSSSDEFDPYQLLFKTAFVQQTIPAHQSGEGRIYYTSGKENITLTAITNHLTSIAAGKAVRVVEVLEADLVIVEPVN